jgi:L-threonylcarbamoyladenylate synthase
MMKSPERIPLQSLLASGLAGPSARLQKIAARVEEGAVFVYPTETIYGIGGSFSAPGVREKIFLAKKRGLAVPLIVIASERKFFNKLSLMFPPAAEGLAQAFWPGMLTLVLPSPLGPDGIAVRVSNHPFIRVFFDHFSTPLYSTSANMSGVPYVNDPEAIFTQFYGAIDFMIDAGPLPESLPSTVVKVGENNKITVVRGGVIPLEKIFAIVKQ